MTERFFNLVNRLHAAFAVPTLLSSAPAGIAEINSTPFSPLADTRSLLTAARRPGEGQPARVSAMATPDPEKKITMLGADRYRSWSLGRRAAGLLLALAVPWGAAPAALQAQPAGLALTLEISQPIYHPGEALAITVTVDNPGLTESADFYVVVRLPDGVTAASLQMGGGASFGRLADLASLVPAARGVSLAGAFSTRLDPFFVYPWNGSEPVGGYRLFLAAVRTGALADGVLGPGELLALESLEVRLDPPLTAARQAAAAATALIPRGGGSVATVAENGTVYTLTVPPGALAADTAITITPVTAIASLPLSGSLLAALDLAPAGTALSRPATLAITLPASVDSARLFGFLYDGVGAGFQVLPIQVAGATLTLQVSHFSTAGAAPGTLADFVSQVQPLLQALPSTLPPGQVQFLLNIVGTWIDRFGPEVCTATTLCQEAFTRGVQSLQLNLQNACAQAFTFVGQGEPFLARSALFAVLALVSALEDVSEVATQVGLAGFELTLDLACTESALRAIINLAEAQAVANPRESLLDLLSALAADAGLLDLSDVAALALAALRDALQALLGQAAAFCPADPDRAEELLGIPARLFGLAFFLGLDPALAEAFETTWAACRLVVSPSIATIPVGTDLQFAATVVGGPGASVAWSVEPASAGSITPGGLFTAGNVEGAYLVVATVPPFGDDPRPRVRRVPITIVAEEPPPGSTCGFPPDQLPPGSYLDSCESCTVTGTLLTCNCRRIDGELQLAQKDFATCDAPLANTDGVLTCGVCQGN
jgi:hypothetical protein